MVTIFEVGFNWSEPILKFGVNCSEAISSREGQLHRGVHAATATAAGLRATFCCGVPGCECAAGARSARWGLCG